MPPRDPNDDDDDEDEDDEEHEQEPAVDQRARRRRVGAWGRTSTDAAAERTSSLRGSKDFRTSRVNGLIPNSSSSDVPNSISQRLCATYASFSRSCVAQHVALPLSLIGEPGVGGLHQVPGFGARLEPHRRDIEAGQNEMALDVAHGERWLCANFLALKR